MMTNGDVIKLYETLVRLSDDKELKFNVKLGFYMARNKEKLRQEAVIIYNQRREIVMERGALDKNNDIIIPKECIDEVNSQINELMKIENKVQIDYVPVDAFKGYELNMEDIEGLMLMMMPEPLILYKEKTPE